MTPQPTIRDVARRAGVSTTTVSHVFSGRRPVASGTRSRVMSVAEEVGYKPDSAARKLASGKSTLIALEIEQAGTGALLNPYFSQVLSELSLSAMRIGFTFTILPSGAEHAREFRPAIRNGSVAGAIVLEPTESNHWVPALMEDGVRVVTIGRFPGDLETSWVDNDHRSGMFDTVRHLAENGYERLVLLTGHQRTSLAIDLDDAFEAAIIEHGLKGRKVFLPDLSEFSARPIAGELLSSDNRPDAIIGAIDRVAVGVIQAASDESIDVPKDLGVVGVGDTVLASQTHPPLTSMRSTPRDLATHAVELVRDIWLDPTTPDTHILLPAELTERESTRRMS